LDVYEFLMNSVGLPLAGKLKHWPVSTYLRELEQSQWWSPQKIEDYQNEKLRLMVRHAYDTTQYYRELFDNHKLTPDDIKTKADLVKIPILQKNTIKADFESGRMLSNAYDHDRDGLVLGKSSGSTGEPVKYYWTRDEKGLRWALIFRYRRWTGWNLGKKWTLLHVGSNIAFPGVPVLETIEKTISRVQVLPGKELTLSNVGDYVRKIQNFQPCMIKGFPSTFYYLAQYLDKHDMKLGVPACVCNGETLYPQMREYIENHFGCGIHDHYGSEGVETAAQCTPNSKYHVSAETVITEVVDNDGNPMPTGTEGRLIVTSLAKWAFPFIRYDTQDIASLSDEKCFCGRGLPLIETIKGRNVDLSVTPLGKPLSIYAFNAPFARTKGIEAWQMVHETPSELVVRVVVDKHAKKDDIDDLMTYVQDYCGDDVKVRMEEVDEIPLTPAGKRRYFISKCSPYQVNSEGDEV
jgi:phenylacetate-CoA ligase